MEPHRLALPPGYCIENYEIARMLGKGGFGITYQAKDVQIGRMVAIKELLPDSIATRVEGSTVVPQSDAQEESWHWARERFVEEARILAGFRHPNIIAVHRIIEANGTVYLVMDCIEGDSCETRLRRVGSISDQASLIQMVSPLLDGLQEVHAAGLLHRDIKPENILDKRGNPVLIDFGAARSAVGATMTMTSIVTHGYSPLEQYQTKGKMGPWTDIYAVGAVMYRAITGSKPPVAPDRADEDEYVRLSGRRDISGFQPKFLEAVDWALNVKVKGRPQNVSEFLRELESKVIEVVAEEPRWMEVPNAKISDVSEMQLVEGGSLPAVSELGQLRVNSFYIARYVVTWRDWKEVQRWEGAGRYDIWNAGGADTDKHPVHSVSWFDSLKWCNAKSEKDGLSPAYIFQREVYHAGTFYPLWDESASGYRLPTEIEWEFAARGGTQSKGYKFSGSNEISDVACFNSPTPSAVGRKQPNELGLYDMSGNVWEWCWDAQGHGRRIRGGSSGSNAAVCAVSVGKNGYPASRDSGYGFRIVRSIVS